MEILEEEEMARCESGRPWRRRLQRMGRIHEQVEHGYLNEDDDDDDQDDFDDEEFD